MRWSELPPAVRSRFPSLVRVRFTPRSLSVAVAHLVLVSQQRGSKKRRAAGLKSIVCYATPSAILLRNATPSLFHQRHIGRVLRSSCNSGGRRLASSRGGKPGTGRCSPLWPGDLRNDGGSVSAAGADGSAARLDGTPRPDDRRGKEVRRVEHLGPGRLERGARARGSGEGRSAAQAGVG